MSKDSIEDLDQNELMGEGGGIYLFQWIASTETTISSVPLPHLKEKQAMLESTLVSIIVGSQSSPPPGRAIRQSVARCLIALYNRGETRTLFDTVQAFLKIINDFKTPDREFYKIAAFSCIGDLMQAFGSQYMSFMSEIATLSLKTLKSSTMPLLRYHALVALRKSLTSAKRAVSEVAFKDLLKQMKNGLSDKCLSIERAAAQVLIAMYTGSDASHPGVADIDAIVTLCVRSLESADQITRHSLSQLVGHVLASTQIPRLVPAAPDVSSKNVKKDQNPLEDDVTSGGSVVTEVTRPLLGVSEMLVHLSAHLNKPNLPRKTRVGILHFYGSLFTKLGPSFIEGNYSLIVGHMMNDVVTPRMAAPRYDVLLLRTLVKILLRALIGVRMLSEQGQIGAIQELSKAYLKRWPAMMPGQVAPNSGILTIALREVAGLLQQLGNAPPPVHDAVAEPLVTLLSHPSHTVRVTASWTLRCFCYSTPLRLAKTIITVMEMLQRDLTTIVTPTAPPEVGLRALGHAYGLASLVCVIPERPLYVSYDISSKVLDTAIQLLKRAGEHDVKIAEVEVEVAWTLIASLMSLGPNFVRPHLPQLLVLWRNALPKPTSKDSGAGRSYLEWMFLLHVRETALRAIFCFLKHNAQALVNLDVGRRIASVLSNSLLFANNLITLNVEEPPEIPAQQQPKGLNLKSREALLRLRVYQCFTTLGFSSIADSTQGTLLQSAVQLFASAEGYNGSSVQAAIASGSFTSVWQSTDCYAYGVTCIEVLDPGESPSVPDSSQATSRDAVDVLIDALLQRPVLGALEHDPLTLLQRNTDIDDQRSEPPPPPTAVVDAAIELFSRLLPLQDLTGTLRTIRQLLDSSKSVKLEKNAGRKSAVMINSTVSVVQVLRHATTNHLRQSRETFGNAQVTSLLSAFLRDPLVDGDHILRSASSESLGRLASLAGTNFLTGQIQQLVDQVVSNRDPHARAGCALAFGAIYSYVGGLAAGPLLKTTVNVLMSLSTDTHPVVHFWALKALARVINAANLAYSPFVQSTLGMLLKVYLMDSHEREGGTLSNVNISGDCHAYPVVCEIIDAVITILGPDMQESANTRNLVLNLVHEFSLEDDDDICVEAIKCFQHFLMFAPLHANIPQLVKQFRYHLASPRRPLKVASINALYQLVQKDAMAMSKLGGDRLVEDLFSLLDDDPTIHGVRDVISSWLQQTVIYNPSAWIDLCQRIMARTTASQQAVDASGGQHSHDDEGESLGAGLPQERSIGERNHSVSRWRTQLFALQCLHQICSLVAQSRRREHIDILFARSQKIPLSGLLVTRVPDMIKMAFTASTAYVTEIRLEGLVVLRHVIRIFASSPDPAFEDTLLLEQHQAPITAALTPAFSSDSTPEILASAIHACAVFVGCGVVKDVNRMGRILKLLTTALTQCKDSGMVSLGDTGELSPNASAMLRISTLSAWAQLEVASINQAYLAAVLEPFRGTLSGLWIASLRDYASIRIDSEFLHDTSSVALDSSYTSLGKEVLLPYYSESWALILQAVATAMRANDGHILAAMDGQEGSVSTTQLSTRTEPTAFFFVIFGLVYEALASSPADTAKSTRQTIVTAALQTLSFLIRPEYAGSAILEPTLFDEFISVCYRMAMTEDAPIQLSLIDMLLSLAITQGSENADRGDVLSLTTPRAHCLRICSYILQHSLPGKGPTINGEVEDRIGMIMAAFSAFSSIASSVTSDQREDIRGVGILLYSELLKDESSDVDLVGPTLPALKSLLEVPPSSSQQARETYGGVLHGLMSSCLLNVDEMRGRQGAISTRKVKSNLLAAVLILTVLNHNVKIGASVIDHCCFLITQKLLEMGEITLTAAHCAKTLIVASASGNLILKQSAKLLLPGLVEYIAKIAPLVHDGSVGEVQAASITEVWKAFSAFYFSVQEANRTRVLSVLLPTVTLLLSNSPTSQSPIISQSVSQILSFATSSPTAFKDATAKLDASTREVLENSVRRAVGGGQSPAPTYTQAKPQISLRSF